MRVYEVATPLRDYPRRIASVLPRALDEAFAACDNRAVSSYGRTYIRRNREELGGLLKLAEGSKAVADFQRFGPYQRLKSLYVQRSAWRRRPSNRGTTAALAAIQGCTLSPPDASLFL